MIYLTNIRSICRMIEYPSQKGDDMDTCLICGQTTEEFYDRIFDVTFHKCKHCEFIARNREATLNVDKEKQIYDLHNNSYENEGYVNMFRDFINTGIVPYIKEGRHALDFGSGPEPVFAQVLEREYDFHVDYYDKFYAPEPCYEGNRYDLITSTEVVEHLDDPIAYFQLFAEHLEDGGLLAIMTLFHHKDDAHFLDWHYRRDRTHISFYTPRTLEVIGERVGLKVLHSDRRQATMKKI